VNKKRLASSLFWILLALPTLLAIFQIRPAELISAPATLGLLGRLAAIGSLTCLLLAAVLAVRVPGFDRLFGGLTKLWRLHHQLGAAAFLLILAHPLLLAFASAGLSLPAAVQTLFPATLASMLGWAALLSTMVFLAPSFSFLGEPEYQRWKLVHRLSGVAILLALGHTFMVPQSLPPPWHWIVWGGLAALAVAAVAYRLMFSRKLGRLRYRVQDVAHPANDVVELTLKPERRPLRYEAGQFIYLTPYDSQLTAGYAEEHPYTLSSAPSEPVLRIAVKALGDASRALQHIAAGAAVKVEGPYGDFFPASPGSELWIAGGIGIAPFLGRARHLAGSARTADVRMIYCVQDEARAIFHEELGRIANRLNGFTLTLHLYYREGPLDAEFLIRHCADLAERDAYICGPSPLLAQARRQLLAAGADADRIHTEEFNLL
jgi:predicted ferric reductase